MPDDFPFDDDIRFGEADDAFHAPGPEDDWTETSFWSFHVAERSLAGWLYVAVRPNLGTVGGGAFVYDALDQLPWEAPYYTFLHHQPFDRTVDLRDGTFPTGVSIRCLEPGMRYRVGYRLPNRPDAFRAELEFTGITPPVPHVSGEPPFTHASHYDQHGRFEGALTLGNETIAVDCVSVRDRSWGPRPEVREHDLRIGYCFGSSSTSRGFLTFTMPRPGGPDDVEHLFGGYVFRDGVVRRLRELTRTNVVAPENGALRGIEVEGADEDGQPLRATGTVRSGTVLPLSTEVAIVSCVEWEIHDGDGPVLGGWGEDQSVHPHAGIRARRRATRA